LNVQGLVILVHMSFLQLNDIESVTSGARLFGLGTFRSGDISVRLRNLAEILHVHILMQTYLNQREVLYKNTTNMIQDPTVDQHQYMIYIIISKQIKSLSTFCNTNSSHSQLQFRFNRNHHSSKGVGVTPARVTFRLTIIIQLKE